MKILIAGIGNIFFGDDGFGVEVARRLAQRSFPPSVTVKDFGIRGLGLAYEIMNGYHLVIIADAAPRGGPPGSVYVIEPESNGTKNQEVLQPHAMSPERVLEYVRSLGGTVPKVRIVGCEPESLGEDGEGRIGLSPAAQNAVDEAIRAVEELVRERDKSSHA